MSAPSNARSCKRNPHITLRYTGPHHPTLFQSCSAAHHTLPGSDTPPDNTNGSCCRSPTRIPACACRREPCPRGVLLTHKKTVQSTAISQDSAPTQATHDSASPRQAGAPPCRNTCRGCYCQRCDAWGTLVSNDNAVRQQPQAPHHSRNSEPSIGRQHAIGSLCTQKSSQTAAGSQLLHQPYKRAFSTPTPDPASHRLVRSTPRHCARQENTPTTVLQPS